MVVGSNAPSVVAQRCCNVDQRENDMDMTTLLIIIATGGGGWYGRGRWF
jgi:hypothetical protein